MPEPADILNAAFQRATVNLNISLVADSTIRDRVEYVAGNVANKAGVRLLMACLLAKIHNPSVDVRKPYTKIGGVDSFSGRKYDEHYVQAFVILHALPCNATTAFLTPAFRNRNISLVPGLELEGRPARLYTDVLQLLDDVYNQRVDAGNLLAEIIRWLLINRNEQQQRIESLLRVLRTTLGAIPLSSEAIVSLIEKHMTLKGTSRLPVLIVAAAYQAAGPFLGEHHLPLKSHNAADIQTGALGDVEITLADDDQVVTSYEMKDRRVTRADIDRALEKLQKNKMRVDNYIFVTTDRVDEIVHEYARSIYAQTEGIEFVVLDCIGFMRHYLHLFHRHRAEFLEAYQSLLLAEPSSSVSQAVKEAFLSMRQVAEEG